ncbi:sensor histidine kinase [Rhizohabitans arisaemae]|uniref:sensor histidine kinase n=1 Tax=Rhizohabitans arisaemae TaxID=2720610 RepID=UPI0024B0BFC8|nr:histidine kinase [Rhizohabitans arisaemae]
MSDRRPLIARRLRPGHWVALDAAAAVLLGIGFSAVAARGGILAILLALAGWLPLAVRRLQPWPVFWWVLAASAATGLTGEPAWFLPVAMALHAVALLQPRRRAVTALLACLAAAPAVVVPIAGSAWGDALSSAVFAGLVMGLTWTAGTAVREQRAHAARAIRQSAREAVTQERLRIARELHDVVTHSMSVITVTAGVANHLADSHPGETRKALTLIEEIGNTALTDMRNMLGLLRRTADQDGHEPMPGLADVPALAERAEAAGVTVETDVDPGLTVSGAIGVAVYRIVQEALTNVIKHVGPTRCRVAVLSGEPGEVRVTVRDDGPHRPAPSSRTPGHGLIGMRERAALHGGRFSAGPRPEGGFLIEATLRTRDG